MSDAVVAADDGNRIVYCNPAAERLLGWPRDELEGQPLLTIIPARLHDAHLQGFSRYLTTGTARLVGGGAVRVPALHRDGHEVEVELTLSSFRTAEDRPVFLASLRDLSERVALERQTAMASYFRATTEVAVLLGLSGTVPDLETAAPLVLEAIGSSLGWKLGALWLLDPAFDALRCLDTWRASDADFPEFEAVTKQTALPRGVGLPGRVWEANRPVWIEDVDDDPNFPRASAAARYGLHGAFAFPILSEGRCLGVIEFFHGDRKPIDDELLAVVATVGGHLGQFLERCRAEQELRATGVRFASVARTLQASLLPPHLPDIPGFDLAARYRPAGGGTEVGGDFYDLFPTRGTTWGVVVGDVCGKGVEAATATALARYTIRAAAMRSRRPRMVLATLNEAMTRQEEGGRFITVAFATVRTTDKGAEAVLSLGGHPPPLVVRADSKVEMAGTPGTVLGVIERPPLSDATITLQRGDALVLYTDGVTEARGAGGLFGEDRLRQAARGHNATAIADAILGAVEEFEESGARDDIAIVVLRVP